MRPIGQRREVLAILPGLLVALVLSTLSQGMVVTGLGVIGLDLGEGEHLPWLMTAFLVASTVAVPLLGKLSDTVGRRSILTMALGIFIVGSALCAVSPSMTWLIAARAVQGAGGGALVSLCLTVMADVIPPLERARYQVLIASIYMVGSLGGPAVGGLIVQHFGWRAMFWVNVPLGVLALFLCSVSLRTLPQNHRRLPLDFTGALLLTATTIILLLAISGADRPVWLTIAMLSASLSLWLLLGWWLLRSANPLISLHLLANGIIRNATLAVAFCSAGLLALTVYLPLYSQTVLGMSASRSGVALIPLLLGSTLGGIIAGQLMPLLRHYRWIATAGLSIATAGLVAIATVLWNDLGSTPLEYLTFLVGVGIGTVPPITTLSVQNATASHELGTATAANNYFRQLFSTVLVAVLGAVVADAGVKEAVEGNPFDQLALSHAFAWVCLGAAAFTTLGLAFLLRMAERPLRGSLESSADVVSSAI